MEGKKKTSLFDKLWFWIIVFTFLMSIVCLFPYLFTSRSLFELDFNKTGPIGDTIGGIMGPFIAIVASFMTFIAFWEQYKFNREQIVRFNNQENDLRIERFENKFYELLKMHKDTVSELEITSANNDSVIKGRRVFVEMFQELQLIHNVVELVNMQIQESEEVENYSKEDVYEVAYLIFFNGYSGSDLHRDKPNNLLEFRILSDRYNALLTATLPCLSWLRWTYQNKDVPFSGVVYKKIIEFKRPDISFKLFVGHTSLLGHYFRGLFQLVNFVISNEIIDDDKKYSYIKTIRSQLSNHEQLMLYYNALSVFGKPWIERDYLNEWRMIKNIPLDQANFYKNPRQLFGVKNRAKKFVFESDEIANRIEEAELKRS